MPELLVDTHCHLNLSQYDSDREDVIQRAAAVGVTRIIIPAIDLQTGDEAIALAHRYQGVFAAVGCHPNSTAHFEESILSQIEQQAAQEKIVAVGEIGLDYHWDDSPREKQIPAFEAQLTLAARLNLPVIIHNRKASEDVIAILEQWASTLPESLRKRPGVLHSVSAPPPLAERALAAGFFLGFTGPITFKKADETRLIARETPLDRILVETDGPYLTPKPYPTPRNEPAYIPYIIEKLAEVKETSGDEIAAITTQNAVRLFNLPAES